MNWEGIRKYLKGWNIFMMISALLLSIGSCNTHDGYYSDDYFSDEELEIIHKNDSALRAFIVNANKFKDSINDAHLHNDHDKAATSQFELLFCGDDYIELALHHQAEIIMSHEWDSMAVWFPIENAILMRHYMGNDTMVDFIESIMPELERIDNEKKE